MNVKRGAMEVSSTLLWILFVLVFLIVVLFFVPTIRNAMFGQVAKLTDLFAIFSFAIIPLRKRGLSTLGQVGVIVLGLALVMLLIFIFIPSIRELFSASLEGILNLG